MPGRPRDACVNLRFSFGLLKLPLIYVSGIAADAHAQQLVAASLERLTSIRKQCAKV